MVPRLRLLRLQACRQIVGRHEPHQIAAHRLGHIEHDHPSGSTGPEPREVSLFVGDAFRLRSPTGIDVDALPVVAPAGRGFVQAPIPGDPVTAMVLDDARLLMKDSVARNRRAVGGARDRHLHREMAARDHPGEQFEGAGRHRVKRSERHRAQVPFYRIAQPLTAFDGRDLRLFEGAADDQPHMAVVAHQTFDAARPPRQAHRR